MLTVWVLDVVEYLYAKKYSRFNLGRFILNVSARRFACARRGVSD